MKKTFEETLHRLMKENYKIIALVADSGPGEKYKEIERDYPGRLIEFGIAECNMVAAAAGLAKEGFIPIVYTLGSFLAFRAYEFIRNDICFQERNVKIVGLSSGVIMNVHGPTHHTTEDIAALRALPNLTLLSPASPKEVPVIIEKSIEHIGPVYVRLGKAFETEIYETAPDFEIGKSNLIQSGDDITIIATGSIIADAIEAAKMLKEQGVNAEIINMSTIKPLDSEAIIRSARKTGRVVTVEEHQINGGLGGAVSEVLCSAGVCAIFDRIGFNDVFCTGYARHKELKKMNDLSPEHIAEVCKKTLEERK
jgi:transketolase